MIGALDTSSSALVAQRTRMDVIAGNIANASVTARPDGTILPYRRRVVSFQTGDPRSGGPGVHVADIAEDAAPFQLRWDPGHPHAIPDGPLAGYVQYPNVSITMEYVDAIEAARAYDANIAVMNVTRDMLNRAIQLFA
jgi:flagellar basal-body rod protein FlgC